MDVLIVGCGYLGTRIADLWRKAGCRVHATTRRSDRLSTLAGQGLIPVLFDVLTSSEPLPAADTTLYCVGLDRTAGSSMREVYVDGLANTLGSLRPGGRLLYVSSSSVYGQSAGEEVDETATTEPTDDSGRVVLEAEQLLRARRPDAVVLRFSGIYGPGRLLRAQAIRSGEPLVGDADKWLNLIHVEDGAAAVFAAAEQAAPGETYNVSDDRPVRRREFYRHLAVLLGAPEPRFVAPAPGRPSPPHERNNRRIVNRKMQTELGVALRYPSYLEGLPASLS
jgi:nucleoside-diphosphate-sugar epimerase